MFIGLCWVYDSPGTFKLVGILHNSLPQVDKAKCIPDPLLLPTFAPASRELQAGLGFRI